MDRNIVYPAVIPQDVDILNLNRNVLIALGYLLKGTFGTSPAVTGLVANLTGTLLVNIGPGALTQLLTVDATAYGSLPADTSDALVKMGITLSGAAVSLAAPGTSGQSINYLIEAQVQDVDGTPVTLPYYNAASPTTPYSGPLNAGTTNNTVRACTVAIQAKAGTAATTNTQTTPAPDSGWVGLWVATVDHGGTTPYNLTQYYGSPAVQTPLQQVQTGFSNQVVLGSGSSSWQVPTGIYKIRVTATGGGGGGGGGGGSTGATYIGGGGAGGGFVRAYFSVTPGTIYSYSVGGGGASGSAGSSTTFGSLLTATGGSAGSAGSGSAPGAGGSTGGSGSASGALGSVDSISGNGGQNGIAAGSTAFGGAGGGAEGRAVGTQNPTYATSGSGAGLGGFGHGDGGSGGVGTGSGGAGAGGRIVIEY